MSFSAKFHEESLENTYDDIKLKCRETSIREEENYIDIIHGDSNPNKERHTTVSSASSSTPTKKSKCEKCFPPIIVLLVVAVAASVAIAVVAYHETAKLRSQVNSQQHGVCKNDNDPSTVMSTQLERQTKSFALIWNEIRHYLKSCNNDSILDGSVDSTQLMNLNMSFNTEIRDLNTSIKSSLDILKKYMSSQLSAARQDFHLHIGAVRKTNDERIKELTYQIVHDIQTIQTFDSCDAVINLYLPFDYGLYRIKSSNSSFDIVNCTFHSCNRVKGYWRRVAYFNTSDHNFAECPPGMKRENDTLSCKYKYFNPGCASVRYETGTTPYSRICGKVHARYSGSPDAFQSFGGARNENTTLEENYLDGVSLTYGRNPRTHIWSFAVSVNLRSGGCEVCDKQRPRFVGMDFSCELVMQCPTNTVCNYDILWNGGQCVGEDSFYKELSLPTTQDIELRLCRGQNRHDEDILITFVELFVM